MADKDVYILLPRTHEYVTLGGKIDFTDRIKLKDSEMGRLSWLVWMGPERARTFQGCGQRIREMTLLTVNMEEQGHETRTVGNRRVPSHPFSSWS